jgi:hypothetical protein
MATDTNIIPQRPTFDNVFADWNNQHLARFGTYVNTATAGAGNYERQVEDLKKQTAQEQAQWDAVYGNTPAAKAISSNPPPTWQDSYNTWIKDYQKVFGTDQLNRPWSADADAAAQKQALDNDYLTSLAKYNEKNGTNIAPQAGVLGVNAQPNSFYKEPEKNNGGLGGVLASIDPGRAIGKGLAEVDTTVNREIPGGWALPAIITAAYLTGYLDPSLLANTTAAEGAAGAGAAGTAGAGTGGALTTTEILGSTGFVPAAGSGASFAIAPEAAYTVAGGAGGAAGGVGGFGLNAASPSGIMATQSAAGLGGAGTGIIEGLSPTSVGMGGTAGAGSLAGIAGSQAAAGLGGAALGTGLTAEQLAAYEAANPGMSTSDILKNVNRARSIANALTGNKTGTTQQSINPNALASLLTSPQAQFGGLYRMNEKPFLSTQQTASLSPDSYNVSGQNINSPIAPTNQLLANLLYPKA